MKLLNIHAHRRGPDSVIDILNKRVTSDADDADVLDDGLWSIGIHPWDVRDTWVEDVLTVDRLAEDPRVVAIGECGLDRLASASLQVQGDALLAQADLAERLSKPLILHCVRAHDELLRLKKIVDPVQPWIHHGYIKGPELARQMIQADIYLSFGQAAVHADTSLRDVIAEVPLDRFFLETDDSTVLIDDVYQAVATIRRISVEALLDVQRDIWTRVLGIESMK
ncbi:MAG TPA: hydrolase TatD [Bacteroidetes bacterium]|nr:hydrolase TatD [Bacteroidota bacterium]HRK05481.1 TatD family hydrolase [Chlorobiota bacterium]